MSEIIDIENVEKTRYYYNALKFEGEYIKSRKGIIVKVLKCVYLKRKHSGKSDFYFEFQCVDCQTNTFIAMLSQIKRDGRTPICEHCKEKRALEKIKANESRKNLAKLTGSEQRVGIKWKKYSPSEYEEKLEEIRKLYEQR